jgi:hypothetical protein
MTSWAIFRRAVVENLVRLSLAVPSIQLREAIVRAFRAAVYYTLAILSSDSRRSVPFGVFEMLETAAQSERVRRVCVS